MNTARPAKLSVAVNIDAILQSKLREGDTALRRSESVLQRINRLLERSHSGER
jgi:hypothetical protein